MSSGHQKSGHSGGWRRGGPSTGELEEWYAHTFPRLQRFAGAIAPRDVDPGDLLHDAITKTIAAARRRSIESPSNYAHTAMVNIAKNHRRRWLLAQERLPLARSKQSTEDQRPSDIDYLLDLPARERAVLFLAVVEGLDHITIGRQLGCSPEASRKALSRGRERIRRQEGRSEGQPGEGGRGDG